jgi:hypothetical protein
VTNLYPELCKTLQARPPERLIPQHLRGFYLAFRLQGYLGIPRRVTAEVSGDAAFFSGFDGLRWLRGLVEQRGQSSCSMARNGVLKWCA